MVNITLETTIEVASTIEPNAAPEVAFMKMISPDAATSWLFIGVNYYSGLRTLKLYKIEDTGAVSVVDSVELSSYISEFYDIEYSSNSGYFYVCGSGRIMSLSITGGPVYSLNIEETAYLDAGEYFKKLHMATGAVDRLYSVVLTSGGNMEMWTFSESAGVLTRTGTTSFGVGANLIVYHIEKANEYGTYFWMSARYIGTAVKVEMYTAGTTGISLYSGTTLNFSEATDAYILKFATNLHEGTPATKLYIPHGNSTYIYTLNGSYEPTLKSITALGIYRLVKLPYHIPVILDETDKRLKFYKIINDTVLREDAINPTLPDGIVKYVDLEPYRYSPHIYTIGAYRYYSVGTDDYYNKLQLQRWKVTTLAGSNKDVSFIQ